MSGDDGLRAAVESIWVAGGRDAADQVLALPELAALRAKAAAADRVRELAANPWTVKRRGRPLLEVVPIDELRRALDGDAPC